MLAVEDQIDPYPCLIIDFNVADGSATPPIQKERMMGGHVAPTIPDEEAP